MNAIAIQRDFNTGVVLIARLAAPQVRRNTPTRNNARIDYMSNQRTGARGEELARDYLRRKGYTILETNWSTVRGELDIVAARAGTLVFVEVKTRRGPDPESALLGISGRKKDRIIETAFQYLQERDIAEEANWRIDVIAVALNGRGPPRIDHVEDAFDW